MKKITKIKIAFIALALQMFTAHVQAQGVNFDWAKTMGSIYSDYGTSITTDASGNVYTTGSFQGTADFDPGTGITNLNATGGSDLFISKVDAAGNLVWAKQIGGNGSDQGNGIVVDTAGNVYVTGGFQDTVDFDPGTGVSNLISAGYTDVFVLKLDASGNFVWAKQLGGPGTDNANGICLDAMGNIYTTGAFALVADFDPGTGVSNLIAAGGSDIFVSKLDASGNFVWAKQMGGTSSDQANGIKVDAAGNVYTTGVFTDSADFDPGNSAYELYTTPYYLTDAFVSKLDASGNFVWAKRLGGAQSDAGLAIALDTTGNVYTTGYFYGTADFDPGTDTFNLVATGANDIYISKLDNAGNFVWAKQMGGTSGDQGSAIATDFAGNVLLTGYFGETADFDPSAASFNLTSAGGQDVFVAKLTAAGNFKWAKQLGGDGYDLGYGLSIDASGSVYTVGTYEDTADFDPSVATYDLISTGSQDIFVQKMYCVDTSSSSLQVNACNSYTMNGETFTTSGTFTQKIPNASGCDSTITLHLTIIPLVAVITANTNVLSTGPSYSSYQWYRNSILISGATDSTYTATSNGSYTVVITNSNGCTDTAAAYNYIGEGINTINTIAQQVAVYPNPATDAINITAPVSINVVLLNLEGQKLIQANNATAVDIKSLPSGVYMLRLTDKNDQLLSIKKIIKE